MASCHQQYHCVSYRNNNNNDNNKNWKLSFALGSSSRANKGDSTLYEGVYRESKCRCTGSLHPTVPNVMIMPLNSLLHFSSLPLFLFSTAASTVDGSNSVESHSIATQPIRLIISPVMMTTAIIIIFHNFSQAFHYIQIKCSFYHCRGLNTWATYMLIISPHSYKHWMHLMNRYYYKTHSTTLWLVKPIFTLREIGEALVALFIKKTSFSVSIVFQRVRTYEDYESC